MKPITDVHVSRIPEVLRQKKQWVVWRLEQRDGKPTKVLYQACAPELNAKTNDKTTWSSFGEALDCYRQSKDTFQFDGVGFVFNHDFVGIDLDKCRNPETKKILKSALDIVKSCASYTEVSPSGSGIHVIVEGQLPADLVGHKKPFEDIAFVEIYDHSRYFAFTGRRLNNYPTTPQPNIDAVLELHKKVFGSRNGASTGRGSSTPDEHNYGNGLSDDNLLEKAKQAVNGAKFSRLWAGEWQIDYKSHSEADAALCFMLAFWTSKDPKRMDRLFRQSGLYRKDKWGARQDYRDRCIRGAIKNTRETYTTAADSETGDANTSIEQQERNRIVEQLRAIAQRATHADPVKREVIRAEMLAHLNALDLKKLGINAPTKLVDTILDEAVGNQSTAGVFMEDVAPAADAVSGQQLLERLVEVFKRFIVVSEGVPLTLSLWVIMTYLIDVVIILPILLLISPEKQCGKTTLLDILECLVCRPLSTSNISAAAMFRSIEKWRPTFLVDELDSIREEMREEVRNVLNAGHKKGKAVVIRCDGPNNEPRPFSVWCPKVLASIKRVPDTVEDRSIVVQMRRKTRTERITRFRQKFESELKALRSQIVRWTQDHRDEIAHLDPVMPDELSDRQQDNWRPLYAIAQLISDACLEEIKKASLDLSAKARDSQNESSLGVQLLNDIRSIFELRKVEYLSNSDLVNQLNAMDERPWHQYKEIGLSKWSLAKLIQPYGIKAEQKREGEDNNRCYFRTSFEDAFSRYLIADTSSTNATNATQIKNQEDTANSQMLQTTHCSVCGKRLKSTSDVGCSICSVCKSGSQQDSPQIDDSDDDNDFSPVRRWRIEAARRLEEIKRRQSKSKNRLSGANSEYDEYDQYAPEPEVDPDGKIVRTERRK